MRIVSEVVPRIVSLGNFIKKKFSKTEKQTKWKSFFVDGYVVQWIALWIPTHWWACSSCGCVGCLWVLWLPWRVWINVSMDGWLSLCVSPVIAWWPIHGVPCLMHCDSWHSGWAVENIWSSIAPSVTLVLSAMACLLNYFDLDPCQLFLSHHGSSVWLSDG